MCSTQLLNSCPFGQVTAQLGGGVVAAHNLNVLELDGIFAERAFHNYSM